MRYDKNIEYLLSLCSSNRDYKATLETIISDAELLFKGNSLTNAERIQFVTFISFLSVLGNEASKWNEIDDVMLKKLINIIVSVVKYFAFQPDSQSGARIRKGTSDKILIRFNRKLEAWPCRYVLVCPFSDLIKAHSENIILHALFPALFYVVDLYHTQSFVESWDEIIDSRVAFLRARNTRMLIKYPSYRSLIKTKFCYLMGELRLAKGYKNIISVLLETVHFLEAIKAQQSDELHQLVKQIQYDSRKNQLYSPSLSRDIEQVKTNVLSSVQSILPKNQDELLAHYSYLWTNERSSFTVVEGFNNEPAIIDLNEGTQLVIEIEVEKLILDKLKVTH